MKKIKISMIILTLAICLGVGGGFASIKADAAYNAKKSAKTLSGGHWEQDYKGYWYQYGKSKFPKNCWKKIDGKIYFFDKSGYMITGWKNYKKTYFYLNEKQGSTKGAMLTGLRTINGKKYFLSKTTGGMVTGWKTIGGKRYYFDKSSSNLGAMVKNQWVGGRYLGKDGVMARNCYVQDGNCYVDSNGKKVTTPPTSSGVGSSGTSQYNSYIFVGDSRTVGMEYAVGTAAEYIAAVGEGYSWMVSSALPQLRAKLDKNPYVKVVFNLGVNDCGSNTAGSYIAEYKRMIQTYPNTKFYIMSVNPVKDKAAKNAGYLIRNKLITPFNNQLSTAFPDIYIDTYNYLMKSGFASPDGLHYTNETYQKIYDYTLQYS